jgi:hypothetical protein
LSFFTRQVAPDGGLIINAVAGVSDARHNALAAANLPTPASIPILAMIDTGASCTCVDPTVLQQLGLTPTGSAAVNTPTTGSNPAMADQYDIGILIPTDLASPPLLHLTIPVIAADLLVRQGFHALVGRDILAGCYLAHDGKSGLFTLAY